MQQHPAPTLGSSPPGSTLKAAARYWSIQVRGRLKKSHRRIEYLKLNIGGHKLFAGDG